MERSSTQVLWGLIFRRDLLQSEERHIFSLLDMLGQTFILEGGQDGRWCMPLQDEVFYVVSFFKENLNNLDSSSNMTFLWKSKALPEP